MAFIDTAQAYGNAEQVLGETLPRPNTFHVISKLPAHAAEQPFDAACEARWQQSLEVTLDRLQLHHLDGLLLHSAGDLARSDGCRLLDWLRTVQQRGLVCRIGLSIYTAADIEQLPLADLQLVQLPCSLYDQRLLADGTVQTCVAMALQYMPAVSICRACWSRLRSGALKLPHLLCGATMSNCKPGRIAKAGVWFNWPSLGLVAKSGWKLLWWDHYSVGIGGAMCSLEWPRFMAG